MKIEEADPPYDKRADGETGRAYHAYSLFRDLGAGRSINKAYDLFLKQRQDNGETTAGKRTAPRHWEEWSSVHEWQSRVASFDFALELKRREQAEAEHLEQLKEFARRRLDAARRLESVYETLITRVEVRAANPDDREGTTAALARAAASIGAAAEQAEAMFLGVDQLYQRLAREDK